MNGASTVMWRSTPSSRGSSSGETRSSRCRTIVSASGTGITIPVIPVMSTGATLG